MKNRYPCQQVLAVVEEIRMVKTPVERYLHTSAVTPRGLLLVGGVEYGGGYSSASALDSTEVFDLTNEGQWRQTSPLPEARWGVRGASLGAVFHIIGGQRGTLLTSVLAWEPVEETWKKVGDLEVAASYRAVTEVPMSMGGPFCS